MGKGPKLPDYASLIMAGIDPKTKQPLKMSSKSKLKQDIKAAISIIDEQDAIRRFKWYNLPDGIDGELIERMLYYRGQVAFFYMETLKKFFILPYALDGTIDVYGRYTGITPLPFNGTSSDGKEDNKPWIQGLHYTPIYQIKYDEVKPEELTGSCVLLHDYAKQIGQLITPRKFINDPICEVEAECIPYMRTALKLGTGVKGVKVATADEQEQVNIASETMDKAALEGDPWIAIIGSMEFQELTDAANLKGADYMQALESIDNFRLSTYGIENGGVFEKKAHMLEQEQAMQGGSVGLVYQDCYSNRTKFCDIVNSLWGLGIWCEPSEAVMGGDVNGDGMGYDNNTEQSATQSGGGEDDTTV